MRSPICLLEDSISVVAFNIAPERANECKKLSDEHKISFEISDGKITDRKPFRISVRMDETATIVLRVAALEYPKHVESLLLRISNPRMNKQIGILETASPNSEE